jgi:hypothetical protein
MNLTRTDITFLKDVHPSVKIDKTSQWRHHYFDALRLNEISLFIRSIKDDKIYLVIPLFVGTHSSTKATLNLSDPFLINNRSNSDLILKFILYQWDNSGFYINTDITFIFKFKRVFIQ